MNTKKWLLALVVVGVLALAFFWNDIPRSSSPKLAIGTSEKQDDPAAEGKSSLLGDEQNAAEQEKSQGSNLADKDKDKDKDKLEASSDQEKVNAANQDQDDKANSEQDDKLTDGKQETEKAADGESEGSPIGSTTTTTDSSETAQGKQTDAKSSSSNDKLGGGAANSAGSAGSKVPVESTGSTGSTGPKSADKSGAGSGAKPVETQKPSQPASGASKPGEKPPVAGKDTKPVESAKPTTTKPVETPKSGGKDGKDKYLTDPVPAGKPKPVEWQDVTINKKKQLSATLSVSSKTILGNLDKFDKDKLEVLPEDGIIYKKQTVTFSEGESVFDVLLREMKKNKIHMEFSMTPIYNSNYIEGINNIYEFDCGELSGWMFKVNDWFPNYGASRYLLKDGDVIEWVYTCDLGRDVGGDGAIGGGGK